MDNEIRAEQLVKKLGFDFQTINRPELVKLLEDEIDNYNEGSSEYLRVLCGYLFCIGNIENLELIKKAKYSINMDVGSMIDYSWIESLEEEQDEDGQQYRAELIQDFIQYYS